MRLLLLPLLLLVTSCSSMYQPKISVFKTEGGTNVEAFEQWTSMFSAVCGAIVRDPQAGNQIVAILHGTCGTPLTMFMGSPVNVGLAGYGLTYLGTH